MSDKHDLSADCFILTAGMIKLQHDEKDDNVEGYKKKRKYPIQFSAKCWSIYPFCKKIEARMSKKKILVIDDGETNRRLIQVILSKKLPEYDVLLASSGMEGIQLAQSESPSIILLDLLMPEMDGYETCKRIKGNATTQSIPIVIISALGDDPEVRTKSLRIGGDAFVARPFYQAELVEIVKTILRKKDGEWQLKMQTRELETHLARQNDEFRLHKERLFQITDYILEFFWEISPEGVVTYLSPVVEKILGFKPEELVGKMNVFQQHSGSHYHWFGKVVMTSLLTDRYIRDHRLIFRHRNGRKVWASVSGFPEFSRAGEFLCYRGVLQDITDRVRTEIELQKSLIEINRYQEKLKQMNAMLSETEEKERRRIAEYLHDGIGQTLSLISIKLSSLVGGNLPSKADQIIRDSVSLINKTISESRTLTYQLSPPILYEFGLARAIQWQLRNFEKSNGLTTKLVAHDGDLQLPEDLNILLFRIVNELVVNAIKHARTNYIEVELGKNGQVLVLSVLDNGPGFDERLIVKSKEGGFGLFSIRERLDSIQGSLHFESLNEGGTKAVVRVPL